MATDGEEAVAFVPGHVTVFFAPRPDDDPARAGSTGAGITLSDGVTVRVAPAGETDVTLNGEPVAVEPVAAALDGLGVTARVALETPLPIGSGFGVSGASTLGAALAVNRALDLGRSENDLVRAAHVAEVRAGTGLGDVVAQARGGLPIRLAAGAPDHGELDGIPSPARIEYRSFGGLSTSEVITGDVADLSAAGERALADLRERPTLPRLFELGRRFAREADLLDPRVGEVIADVGAAGGEAVMAMLGETVVALGTGLSDAGYDATACETSLAGAGIRMA